MPALYITHPEVVIDPAVAPPRWGLSDLGRARAEAFAARDLVPHATPIFASTEPKASQLAEIIASRSGSVVMVRRAFGENDRSSTGYLAGASFEAMVDRFFGNPDHSQDGWESASDAQRRIVAAVREAIAEAGKQPVVFCGHGAVGTLLKCHVGGRPIARHEDQRVMAARGGGNCFVFELAPLRLISDWTAMEDCAGLRG